MDKTTIEHLTEDVKKLAIEAGNFLVEQRKSFDRSKVENKRSHDYVSYVDKESEKMIVSRLKELLPEAGFIAEEGTQGRNGEDLFWTVDPLDGTTNFIHDNAPYCVSIALCDKSEALLGVVYECCRKELFWANKYGEAYLNDKPIKVSEIAEMDNAFIELGFPYDSENTGKMMPELAKRLYGNVGGIRLQGSAASELCYIACGRFEARIEPSLGAWDIATGALILKQAGGKVTDFHGNDIYCDGKEVLASNGKLHTHIKSIVEDILQGEKQ